MQRPDHRVVLDHRTQDSSVDPIREGLSFDDVAQRVGLDNADAARMRYHRALPRLGRLLPREEPTESEEERDA